MNVEEYRRKNINWIKLREKFFRECTHEPFSQGTDTGTLKKVNLAPHDLFEWFKRNIQKA
jgi:hypothetical protein